MLKGMPGLCCQSMHAEHLLSTPQKGTKLACKQLSTSTTGRTVSLTLLREQTAHQQHHSENPASDQCRVFPSIINWTRGHTLMYPVYVKK